MSAPGNGVGTQGGILDDFGYALGVVETTEHPHDGIGEEGILLDGIQRCGTRDFPDVDSATVEHQGRSFSLELVDIRDSVHVEMVGVDGNFGNKPVGAGVVREFLCGTCGCVAPFGLVVVNPAGLAYCFSVFSGKRCRGHKVMEQRISVHFALREDFLEEFLERLFGILFEEFPDFLVEMLVHVGVEVQVENGETVLVREFVQRGSVEAEEPADVQEVVIYVGGSEFLVRGGGSLDPVRPVLEKVHVAQLYGMEHFVVYGDPDAVSDVFVVGVRVGRVV